MKRGDVYEARFDPTEGTEQAGIRPAVVVSHDDLNESVDRVIVVPVTTFRGQRIYASQVLLRAPEGGLTRDSVVLCEQIRVLAKSRLLRQRGTASAAALRDIEAALAAALNLHLAAADEEDD